MPERRDDEDPFDGWTLDDDFVRAASKREPSGADRIERAAVLRRHVAQIDAARRRENRVHRRAARALRHRLPSRTSAISAVMLAAVLTGMWWVSSRPGGLVGGLPVTGAVPGSARPTPEPAMSPTPLGTPVEPPSGSGAHRFIATQLGSDAPVAYDPCRPIRVVVNERTMPPGAVGMVDAAIDEVSRVTGLRFEVEGPSDEPATEDREAFQPDRYGDRWAPVLVAWSDPDEYPGIGDDVAGVAGSRQVTVDDVSVFVTGIVYLDGSDFDAMLRSDDGWALGTAIVMHELGHLVGLDHVHDADELMHDDNVGLTEFADGDIAGLTALGRGACVPEL